MGDPAAARSLGRTSPSTSAVISRGTPGTAKIHLPSCSRAMPSATPCGFGRTSAPSGWSAIRSELSANVPRLAMMRRLMASACSWSRAIDRPVAAQIASRVRSSWVGPIPPVRTTASALSNAVRIVSVRRVRLSPTTT